MTDINETPEGECRNIEAIIEQLFTPEYLACIGADVQGPGHSRPLYQRVMRLLGVLAEWEQENAPGGWIDGLRKQNDAARDALVQIQRCSTDPKIQALAEAGLNPCASDEPATHERKP